MKTPNQLSFGDLEQIVTYIQLAAFNDDDGEWDPDKELGGEFIGFVVEVLEKFGLKPDFALEISAALSIRLSDLAVTVEKFTDTDIEVVINIKPTVKLSVSTKWYKDETVEVIVDRLCLLAQSPVPDVGLWRSLR